MNELRTAQSICRVLDVGAGRLSYRAEQRLTAARQAALARLAGDEARQARHAVGAAGAPTVVAAAVPAPSRPRSPRSGDASDERPPSFWRRLAYTTVPAAVLLVALVVADTLQQEQVVEDLAEVDSALLTDDLPLVAYADHGFGVYLKNTRR